MEVNWQLWLPQVKARHDLTSSAWSHGCYWTTVDKELPYHYTFEKNIPGQKSKNEKTRARNAGWWSTPAISAFGVGEAKATPCSLGSVYASIPPVTGGKTGRNIICAFLFVLHFRVSIISRYCFSDQKKRMSVWEDFIQIRTSIFKGNLKNFNGVRRTRSSRCRVTIGHLNRVARWRVGGRCGEAWRWGKESLEHLGLQVWWRVWCDPQPRWWIRKCIGSFCTLCTPYG